MAPALLEGRRLPKTTEPKTAAPAPLDWGTRKFPGRPTVLPEGPAVLDSEAKKGWLSRETDRSLPTVRLSSGRAWVPGEGGRLPLDPGSRTASPGLGPPSLAETRIQSRWWRRQERRRRAAYPLYRNANCFRNPNFRIFRFFSEISVSLNKCSCTTVAAFSAKACVFPTTTAISLG